MSSTNTSEPLAAPPTDHRGPNTSADVSPPKHVGGQTSEKKRKVMEENLIMLQKEERALQSLLVHLRVQQNKLSMEKIRLAEAAKKVSVVMDEEDDDGDEEEDEEGEEDEDEDEESSRSDMADEQSETVSAKSEIKSK